MKKNILFKRVLVFFVCITVITSIFSVTDIVKAVGNEAGFYISANLPDNQIDKNVSYFDLKMKPSQKQTVYIDIYNEKNEELEISVYTANASSNSNGIIDYTKSGIADESMIHPFENIAKIQEESIIVPASGKKSVAVNLTMPEKEYDGIVLGGVVFRGKEDQDTEITEESVTINNVISYAMAFQLSQTDKIVNIDPDLIGVEPRVINYEPVITHYIRNKAAALATRMQLNIDIVKKDTQEEVLSSENDNVSIAPNSVMPYSFSMKDKKLEAGDYISKVTLKYNDKEDNEQIVNFSKEFSVDKEYTNTVDDYNTQSSSIPVWAIIIIAGLGILIAAVAVLIAVIVRKKRYVGKT